jgi:hypothetical protein
MGETIYHSDFYVKGIFLADQRNMHCRQAAWQQGRKELFYPYGKTYAQTHGEQD